MVINFRRIYSLLKLLLFSVFLVSPVTSRAGDIYNQIMDKVKVTLLDVDLSETVKRVDDCLIYYSNDGSFKNVNYSDKTFLGWKPIAHVDNVRNMIVVYLSPNNKYYQSIELHTKIEASLRYWKSINLTAPNWWYNQIGVPQRLEMALIGMRYGQKHLNESLEDSIVRQQIQKGGDPVRQNGANRVDVALHWLYTACLQKNVSNLKYAVDQTFSTLAYTMAEGFQHDGSFLQHDQQLYIGGYGKAAIQAVIDVAYYMDNTPYALSGDKLAILSDFVRNTFLKAIRGQNLMFNTYGRHISAPNHISANQIEFIPILERLKIIDPKSAIDYVNAISRIKQLKPASYGLKPSNAHYWRADYTLHQRPGYTFDVRMATTRTCRSEIATGNGTAGNLKGFLLVDGATNIGIDGEEYKNIFPVWDWNKVPGITAPEMDRIPRAPNYIFRGTSTFAGGVSDGIYGVTCYDLSEPQFNINTKAKKSWFFFDKEVVCFGAGINSTASEPINTTVNQCLLKGEVILSVNGSKTALAKGNVQSYSNNVDWVLHNHVGYYFPRGGEFCISSKQQKGTWYDINDVYSKDTVRQDVFKLWINHGVKPKAGSYVYVVVPNLADAKEASNYRLSDNIDILSNTEVLQVVRHRKLGIYGLVFYLSGTFTDGEFSVTVDKPCVLLVSNIHKSKLVVKVADPSQVATSITIKTNFHHRVGMQEVTCRLPLAPYAGSTQEVKIE